MAIAFQAAGYIHHSVGDTISYWNGCRAIWRGEPLIEKAVCFYQIFIMTITTERHGYQNDGYCSKR